MKYLFDLYSFLMGKLSFDSQKSGHLKDCYSLLGSSVNKIDYFNFSKSLWGSGSKFRGKIIAIEPIEMDDEPDYVKVLWPNGEIRIEFLSDLQVLPTKIFQLFIFIILLTLVVDILNITKDHSISGGAFVGECVFLGGYVMNVSRPLWKNILISIAVIGFFIIWPLYSQLGFRVENCDSWGCDYIREYFPTSREESKHAVRLISVFMIPALIGVIIKKIEFWHKVKLYKENVPLSDEEIMNLNSSHER